LSADDVAARVGGDEFVVLAQAPTQEQAIAKGQRLIAAIACTYALGDGISAAVGASTGIALAPEHGNDPEGLLAVADAALYEAKSTGKSRCCMASPLTNLAALRACRPPSPAPPRAVWRPRSMIRKSGIRFSERIMLHQNVRAPIDSI